MRIRTCWSPRGYIVTMIVVFEQSSGESDDDDGEEHLEATQKRGGNKIEFGRHGEDVHGYLRLLWIGVG
jgi:hypothetical protein